MVRTTKIVVAAIAVALAALVVAAPSSAATTLNVNATFTEQFGGPMHSPFSCASGDLCGTGRAAGLGRISESIVFGGGCGGGCDLRTITFADGSTLVLEESEGDTVCPGNSDCRTFNDHSYGNPFSIPLTDTVNGALSTGVFAGASGTLTGQVMVAGGVAQIGLSGPVTLA